MFDMASQRQSRFVVGPDGEPLTVADLPDPKTDRWVIKRKAQVVAAVRGGLLSLPEAGERYRISIDELITWHALLDTHGMRGLRTTQIGQYR